MQTIILKPKKEESLKRFHPWVFSGAILRMEDSFGSECQPEEGDWVRVVSAHGEFLALGQYQIGSIAVRVFSFDEDEMDDDFFRRRLEVAYKLRQTLGLAGKGQAFRLVHGEGDMLPGLIIDVYGETAVMQAHTQGIHNIREALAEDLVAVANGAIRNVYYKSETTLSYKTEARRQEGAGAGETVNGYLIINGKPVADKAEGRALESTISDVAIENGLKFHVDWLKGQKTGFFVDQRENRALVEQYAKGRKVLNMFCYTGGFSFYAMRGGAEQVHSVDVSQQAINITNANVELNFPGDPRHEAFCEDAFHYLDRMNDVYDLIILDPPAFAKHRKVLHNALQGYRRLNAKAFERIKPGGILFTFSCSQVVTKDDFRCAVFSAAAQSGRRVRILHQLHQPADHPINIYHPEGEYLKGLVLYVE